jgi:DNA-binding MarR family transcriptional regulator
VSLDARRGLALWHGALKRALKAEAPVLSTRQMGILLTVYLDPGPHTLRQVASALRIPESAAARALDVLERHDFLRRRRDQQDRRAIQLHRTVKGAVYLNDWGELVAKAEGGLRS